MSGMNRRAALGAGSAAAAAVILGTGRPAAGSTAETEGSPQRRVTTVYHREALRAGGTWNSYISLTGSAGAAVSVGADERVEAFSVNKVAVAVAVLDKVDRGLLRLDQRVEVTADIVIAAADGIFALDGAYPSSVTIGHAMAALLTVSDDTAVRLCGLVCPARELNDILVAKGFPNTQVVPVANPNRFFLGQTTPRETHDLLRALAGGSLLSAPSTTYLLTVLRSLSSFTDGVRRNMSSDERLRIATKAGWFADGRNEAGIIFGAGGGGPALTYAMFARGQADPTNFGATHPAVEARARMGRPFLEAANRTRATGTTPVPAHRPANGG